MDGSILDKWIELESNITEERRWEHSEESKSTKVLF